MDCLGRIGSGYSSESCQLLHVDTDIMYRIEEQRFPGLREGHCEPSLRICSEYLAVQRLKHGTRHLAAHPGTENQSIDETHRELYSLIDGLDFLSADLPHVPDQFVETLLEMTTTEMAEEESSGVPRPGPSCDEPTDDTMDCDDVFLCGATDNDNVQTPFTVSRSDSSCCTSKPQRKPTTNQTSRTFRCSADVMSKPRRKRRYSSVSQEVNDVTHSCIKRRKLSSRNMEAGHERTELSNLTVSSTLLSPFGVFSQSYSGYSPLRPTSLRQW